MKPPLHLLPVAPLREIARVFKNGAEKYALWDWLKRPRNLDDDKAALLHHVLRYTDASVPNSDKDSGLHHLAHACARAMIIIWHEEKDDDGKTDPRT